MNGENLKRFSANFTISLWYFKMLDVWFQTVISKNTRKQNQKYFNHIIENGNKWSYFPSSSSLI